MCAGITLYRILRILLQPSPNLNYYGEIDSHQRRGMRALRRGNRFEQCDSFHSGAGLILFAYAAKEKAPKVPRRAEVFLFICASLLVIGRARAQIYPLADMNTEQIVSLIAPGPLF
jgi:hypothetical protein